MTASEFSSKYGIPYTIVHAASFRTASRQPGHWRRQDYGEPELKKAVREELEERMRNCVSRAESILVQLDRLGVKAESIRSLMKDPEVSA